MKSPVASSLLLALANAVGGTDPEAVAAQQGLRGAGAPCKVGTVTGEEMRIVLTPTGSDYPSLVVYHSIGKGQPFRYPPVSIFNMGPIDIGEEGDSFSSSTKNGGVYVLPEIVLYSCFPSSGILQFDFFGDDYSVFAKCGAVIDGWSVPGGRVVREVDIESACDSTL